MGRYYLNTTSSEDHENVNDLLMEGDSLVVVSVPGGYGQEDGTDGRRQRQVDAETQR